MSTLKSRHYLSNQDKMILKEIFSYDDRKTSTFLSKRTGIPLTTVQRRRRRLEKNFLETTIKFCLQKFGWRRVDFFISTANGKTDQIGKELLAVNEVISVGKSIGQHTIDLRVETIVKDNGQILDIMENMKAIDGIKDVIWSEIVIMVGKNKFVPRSVIDQL